MQYHERLRAPVVWWVLAVLFALSAGVAVGFYLGPLLGVGVGLVALAIAAGVVVSAGILIVVDDQALRVGRAMIEFAYLGGAEALDETQTARRTGPEADARAYLVLRPYVKTAVQVELDDAADPVPYWLISTRRPEILAAALTKAALTKAGG